jgi:hypothetical protein
VCGSDGSTYSSICELTQERYRRRDGLVVISKSACVSAPIIVTSPKNIKALNGQNVAFDCEVNGWPVPDIKWRYLDASKDPQSPTRDLPGDDPDVAVQTRGGPNDYEVSGWLQILNVKNSTAGTYTCVAINEQGHSSAAATLQLIDAVENEDDNDVDD